jgi:hypothetical protein
MASPMTYVNRFGSLIHACELVGYLAPKRFSASVKQGRRTTRLIEDLLGHLVQLLPEQLSVVRAGSNRRPELLFQSRFLISVMVGVAHCSIPGTLGWTVPSPRHDWAAMTLLCLSNQDNENFGEFYLFSSIKGRGRLELKEDDPWFRDGIKLTDLRQLPSAVNTLRRQGCRFSAAEILMKEL